MSQSYYNGVPRKCSVFYKYKTHHRGVLLTVLLVPGPVSAV